MKHPVNIKVNYSINIIIEILFQRCPKWNDWSEWSQCDRTCGNGEQTRQRYCLNGNVGDIGCIGAVVEIKQCENLVSYKLI